MTAGRPSRLTHGDRNTIVRLWRYYGQLGPVADAVGFSKTTVRRVLVQRGLRKAQPESRIDRSRGPQAATLAAVDEAMVAARRALAEKEQRRRLRLAEDGLIPWPDVAA